MGATSGVEALVYMNSSYAKDKVTSGLGDAKTGHDLWIAYCRCSSSSSPDCGKWGRGWVFWQYWAPTTPDVVGCNGHGYGPGTAADVDPDLSSGGMIELAEYLIP